MQQLIQQLIRGFDDSPANSGRLMRELLEKDRAAFLPAAMASLRQTGENRGYRYLVALLAGNDLLAQCVSDPSLSAPAAVLLARIGMQMSPTLDTVLARELVSGLAVEGGRGDERAIRMLDILGEISDGPRLLPLLSHLLRYPNPRVRSKVALLMGRRNQSSSWVERRKDEVDPRVRANAVEGLWGAGDDGARRVLWEASRDPHNRVAGNALIGLYRLGDTRAIERILEIAAHPDPLFRASAAWVMGESADPRFLTVLGRMLADGDKIVRARSFRSVATIRRRCGELAQNGRLQVHLWEARRLPDGIRRLRLTVVNPIQGFPALSATQFMVAEGSQAVTAYEVRRRPAPAALAIGFGLPRGIEARAAAIELTLLECLRQKRPGHQWGMVSYCLDNSIPAETEVTVEPPRFIAKAATLAALIERRSLKMEAADGLLSAARLLLAGAASLAGERHLVLIGSPEDKSGCPEAANSLGEKARYHGVAIHGVAIAGGGGPVLQSLCETTGGRLFQAQGEEEVRAALIRIFWGLQYREEIQYRLEQGEMGPTLVRVQIRSDVGMAEDFLPLE